MYSESSNHFYTARRSNYEFKRCRQFPEDDPLSGRLFDAVNKLSVDAYKKMILVDQSVKVSEIA